MLPEKMNSAVYYVRRMVRQAWLRMLVLGAVIVLLTMLVYHKPEEFGLEKVVQNYPYLGGLGKFAPVSDQHEQQEVKQAAGVTDYGANPVEPLVQEGPSGTVIEIHTTVRGDVELTGTPQDPPPIDLQLSHVPPEQLMHPAPGDIVILTGSDRGDAITQMAIKNRKEYAEKHGYNFHYTNFTSYYYVDQRHESWKKINSFREAFKRYPDAKWVWWLDVDAIIMNERIDLAYHLLNEHVLLQRISYNTHVRYVDEQTNKIKAMAEYFAPNELNVNNVAMIVSQDAKGLNAGSMFLKRGYFTETLLNHWETLADSKHVHHEQGALWSILNKDLALLNYVGIVPQRLINGHTAEFDSKGAFEDGDFVLHFASNGSDCAKNPSCVQQWNSFWARRVQ